MFRYITSVLMLCIFALSGYGFRIILSNQTESDLREHHRLTITYSYGTPGAGLRAGSIFIQAAVLPAPNTNFEGDYPQINQMKYPGLSYFTVLLEDLNLGDPDDADEGEVIADVSYDVVPADDDTVLNLTLTFADNQFQLNT